MLLNRLWINGPTVLMARWMNNVPAVIQESTPARERQVRSLASAEKPDAKRTCCSLDLGAVVSPPERVHESGTDVRLLPCANSAST